MQQCVVWAISYRPMHADPSLSFFDRLISGIENWFETNNNSNFMASNNHM